MFVMWWSVKGLFGLNIKSLDMYKWRLPNGCPKIDKQIKIGSPNTLSMPFGLRDHSTSRSSKVIWYYSVSSFHQLFHDSFQANNNSFPTFYRWYSHSQGQIPIQLISIENKTFSLFPKLKINPWSCSPRLLRSCWPRAR